ncbi:ABC transporter substrate-binding protein [Lachnospiraceae bacterium OF09-33XD]|nr:ABC transporter substrate-binding protein [Lachnospiraceae bacterium OF09-33XD]
MICLQRSACEWETGCVPICRRCLENGMTGKIRRRKMKKRIVNLLLAGILSVTAVLAAGCGSGKSSSNSGEEGENTVSAGSENAGSNSASSSGSSDNAEGDEKGTTVYPLTVEDDLGNEVIIEEEPERVVSLSPANTETLFALGAGERIVGRTDYCSYPEEAAEVESVGTYTAPNTELIISLSPDVVFASDYIDDAVRDQVEEAGAKVVVFSANDVKSVEKNIETAGQILNLNEKAQELTESMTAELEELKDVIAEGGAEKSAFIDLGSYYSAGTGSLLGNMLNDLSVRNIAEDTGETWPQLSLEKIIESDPDIYISLFTSPEELKQTSGLNDLECIKNGNIIYFEGLSPEADMIQRAGPRIVEGTKLLAEKIYPELFS